MAYLKSTNIDGDLSVTGGVTVSNAGIIRQVSGQDFYLGTTPGSTVTDMNNLLEPTISYISSDNVENTLNYPSEYAGKVIVLRQSTNVATQMVIDNGSYIYIRNIQNLTTTPTFNSWRRISEDDDSGWQYVTLNPVVVPYDNNQGYMPRYRKIGNLVQVKGTLSPSSSTNSFGSSGGAAVFPLPEGYRPSVIPVTSVFQGTSTSSFAMSINTLGVATISRYRDENGYETPITSSWMPFHFEYFADQ